MDLPYLTKTLPGIGGRIKQQVEDFIVDEVPLYEPCGEGTHVYFRVRKAGVPTSAAVDRIARYMGVSPGQIGVAGRKDAQAITTQMMSLEHADADKLETYRDAQVKVIGTNRHGNKLRPGHLAGNRFQIRIRDTGPDRLPAARKILDILLRRGVPNFFGPQRFGARGETASLGEALLKGDLQEFVAVLLGRARVNDPPDIRAARDAFDAGSYSHALNCWPRHYHNERRALSAYKRKSKAGPAVGAIDRRMRKLYVSAFQSAMFNEVLTQRIDAIDQILTGDYAIKADTGGIFVVEDAAVEQPRADRFEISPAGPVFGYRTSFAQEEPGQIERQVLSAHGVELEEFRRVGQLKVKGTRRAMRFKLSQPSLTAGADETGQFIEVRFTATSGSYATVAVREIMKSP